MDGKLIMGVKYPIYNESPKGLERGCLAPFQLKGAFCSIKRMKTQYRPRHYFTPKIFENGKRTPEILKAISEFYERGLDKNNIQTQKKIHRSSRNKQ
jgi:hypothetical protein